jgi:hypothetical protein
MRAALKDAALASAQLGLRVDAAEERAREAEKRMVMAEAASREAAEQSAKAASELQVEHCCEACALLQRP